MVPPSIFPATDAQRILSSMQMQKSSQRRRSTKGVLPGLFHVTLYTKYGNILDCTEIYRQCHSKAVMLNAWTVGICRHLEEEGHKVCSPPETHLWNTDHEVSAKKKNLISVILTYFPHILISLKSAHISELMFYKCYWQAV